MKFNFSSQPDNVTIFLFGISKKEFIFEMISLFMLWYNLSLFSMSFSQKINNSSLAHDTNNLLFNSCI